MALKPVFEKLDAAVLALVYVDAPLSERLESAIAALTSLTEKELPPDCRKEFRQVQEAIRAYGLGGNRADLQPALAQAIYGLLKSFIGYTSGFSGSGLMPM